MATRNESAGPSASVSDSTAPNRHTEPGHDPEREHARDDVAEPGNALATAERGLGAVSAMLEAMGGLFALAQDNGSSHALRVAQAPLGACLEKAMRGCQEAEGALAKMETAGGSVTAHDPGAYEYMAEPRRVDVIRAAACELSELAQLISDRALAEDEGEEITPRVLQTLTRRMYELGNFQLRCLDESEDPSQISAEAFPPRCFLPEGDAS